MNFYWFAIFELLAINELQKISKIFKKHLGPSNSLSRVPVVTFSNFKDLNCLVFRQEFKSKKKNSKITKFCHKKFVFCLQIA